jgi:hypothetical protein
VTPRSNKRDRLSHRPVTAKGAITVRRLGNRFLPIIAGLPINRVVSGEHSARPALESGDKYRLNGKS